MELDDALREAVAEVLRSALGLPERCDLVGFGREARLEETDDDTYARVDLWLLFRDVGYAFLEIKTHDRWEAEHVAKQVRDQATRSRVARSSSSIRGSMLLAPPRLCERVRAVDPTLPILSWKALLRTLKDIGSPSPLTQHALRHLEEHVDRPTGIAERTLDDFERAATTISCLRQFLIDCAIEIGGKVRVRESLWMTPGDGEPRRGGGWAWFGLSVPFTVDDTRYRLGIYKYVEAPPGDDSRKTLWLEAYDGDDPVAYVEFDARTLAPAELDAVRERFKSKWVSRGATLPAG